VEQTKPFTISKRKLLDAYRAVQRNGGAAGIDGMTLEDVKKKEKDLLYKLWNRMSSGSYQPQAVKRVDIPKKSGGTRPLGIPTVVDRIAQMTARLYLEPLLEPHFHPDSYGYRPKKSAHQAVEVTRRRCWEYDWVLDVDIKGFFDTIDHELLLKAVDFHKPEPWVRLYIERWLKAPAIDADGIVLERNVGTPQGGVISPLLANLFLHYAFDSWMVRNYRENPFARYADDLVIHCRSKEEAEQILEAVKTRFGECKLTVHPEKTKIVYCKDDNRDGSYEETEFDFLGFTFRPRHAKNRKGQYFVSFSPAISAKAEKAILETIRSWKIHTRSGTDLRQIAHEVNPRLRGWLNYYGRFRRSALSRICDLFQVRLIKWAKNKYRRLKGSWRKASDFLATVAKQEPKYFAHWEWSFSVNGRI